MPVNFQHTKNPYVSVTPVPAIAASVTYKKEWQNKKGVGWYIESGLTTQGLNYYQVDYTGDSLTIWTNFYKPHNGFPSVLFGSGLSRNIGKRHLSSISAGVEGSYLLTQSLFMHGSNSFGLLNDPSKHATAPLFLRLNIAYNRRFKCFKSLPFEAHFYTNLSFQKLTKGAQIIRNPQSGEYREGEYYVNNSELGLKIFAYLNKRVAISKSIVPKSVVPGTNEWRSTFRISVTSQLYVPTKTIFYIPQIDSFSVQARKNFLLSPQIGINMEIPIAKNNRWYALAGLGLGYRYSTMRFKSTGQFSADGRPVNLSNDITYGHYVIANIGISRNVVFRNTMITNALSATFTVPTEKEYGYLGIPLMSEIGEFPPYKNPILEGAIDYKYGRSTVLVGVEYNPEFNFHILKSGFMAVGLVFNLSRGVMAQGLFTVSNDDSKYYGALIQHFSKKIGLSVRIGWNKPK